MGFISWGRCHSEVIQQKWVDFFSQILETITCQKISRKKNTFNSALTTYQTNKCCGLHLKKKIDILITTVAIKRNILLHPKKPWNLLKPWLAPNVHANCTLYFFSVPSTSLKSELQFLIVSEMGIFHIIALNFKEWPFCVILTRHFRSKSGHFNEKAYCKPIDRTLKMFFIKGSDSFLRPIFPELWKLLDFG